MYRAAPRTVCEAAAGRVCTVTRFPIEAGRCEVIQDGPPLPPSDPVINPEWPLLGELVCTTNWTAGASAASLATVAVDWGWTYMMRHMAR